MKKKIVSIVIIVVIAGYNIYTSHNNISFSDLALANIEALAADPEITFPYVCAGEVRGCYDAYYDEIFQGVRVI